MKGNVYREFDGYMMLLDGLIIGSVTLLLLDCSLSMLVQLWRRVRTELWRISRSVSGTSTEESPHLSRHDRARSASCGVGETGGWVG